MFMISHCMGRECFLRWGDCCLAGWQIPVHKNRKSFMSNTMSSFDLSVDSSLAEEKHVWTSDRIVIAGLALLTAGLIATKPGLVHYEFPIASLLAGALLYRRNPVLYVAFTIWLYFLSPLIRRVVDF